MIKTVGNATWVELAINTLGDAENPRSEMVDILARVQRDILPARHPKCKGSELSQVVAEKGEGKLSCSRIWFQEEY